MNRLPLEIIEQILSYPDITLQDVLNFSSTCNHLRALVSGSKYIWKKWFIHRWKTPDPRSIQDVENWMDEYIFRVQVEQKTFKTVEEMSPRFFKQDEIKDSDLEYVNELVESSPNAYYYVADCLKDLNYMAGESSLTVSYYGNKLLKYLKRRNLKKHWIDLNALDLKEHTLERGVTFVSRWFQINDEVIEETVVKHLNYAAEVVKKVVKQRYPDHPLNHVRKEDFLKWQNENIQDNKFEPELCKQIISCITHVLFIELEYTTVYDVWVPHIRFAIDSALFDKKTTPFLIAVIYESVARRLGVRCEIVFYPSQCWVRWKENYRSEKNTFHFIDLSGRETFVIPECYENDEEVGYQCPALKPNIENCDMEKIVTKAAQDILRADRAENGFNPVSDASVLELLLMFSPTSVGLYRQLGRYYMRKNMDLTGLYMKLASIDPQALTRDARLMYNPLMAKFESYMRNMEGLKTKTSRKVKYRTRRIEFAVGMIGRHKIYHYTCVIIGWDPHCKASQNWIHVNGIAQMLFQAQPFYNVLADDGMEHYVAQEYLRLNPCPPVVFHPDIGRFFDQYCATHYRANEQLREEYPEDTAALQIILRSRNMI